MQKGSFLPSYAVHRWRELYSRAVKTSQVMGRGWRILLDRQDAEKPVVSVKEVLRLF